MDENTSNPWALSPINGWEEASNTLDTLLYRELTKAEQRRHEKKESLLQSAHTIRNKMLHRMNGFKKFDARDSDPELLLMNNICRILDLPAGSITKLNQDRAAI